MNAKTDLGPWFLGIGALLLVPFLLALAPPQVSAWGAAYIAGAVGGLTLELIRGGWGVELPSSGYPPKASTIFRPIRKWKDIGFLGRMATGGIAAPVFLVIIKTVLEDASAAQLLSSAASTETLAWAVLLGAASPAAWDAGQRLVEARLGAVETRLKAAGDIVGQAADVAGTVAKSGAADGAEAGRVVGHLEAVQVMLAQDGSGES